MSIAVSRYSSVWTYLHQFLLSFLSLDLFRPPYFAQSQRRRKKNAFKSLRRTETKEGNQAIKLQQKYRKEKLKRPFAVHILQKSARKEIQYKTPLPFNKISDLLNHSIVDISSDDEEGITLGQSTQIKFFPFNVLQALHFSAESMVAKRASEMSSDNTASTFESGASPHRLGANFSPEKVD